MKNNNPNNYQENKIDLIEVISVLIASKKIVIITTLIFTLITTVYAYTLKPDYMSSARIFVGSVDSLKYKDQSQYLNLDNTLILNVKYIENELRLFVSEDFQLVNNKGGFLTIQVTNPSKEYASNSIKEIVDYLIEKSNKTVANVKEAHRINIESLSTQISFIESEWKRIKKIGLEQGIVNPTEVDPTLVIKLNQLKTEKNNLSLKFSYLNNFENINTKLHVEISTDQLNPSKQLIILLGFIAGFILSILIVFFRESLRRDDV